MTRKRRMFEIDMPDDLAAETPDPAPAPPTPKAAPTPPSAPARRGPMASAIAENAEALQARKSAAQKIREENDALAHEYVALQAAGHVVRNVGLDQVHTYLLVRDRIKGDDFELAELVTSIRELGLSNPIRVMARPEGDGFELVQGYRRLAAYRQLLQDSGEDRWAEIPALIIEGDTDIAGLYRRMVDENVIRKDLSFAEMAHAAQAYAADPATEANDLSAAVAALFQSAAYSKRSYIRAFAALLDRLGDTLAYPTEIPRALGVTLARAIKDRPDLVAAIRDELRGWEGRSITDELGVLRRFAGMEDAEIEPEPTPKRSRGSSKTKTTFHISSSAGQVKCTAGPGRLEIKVNRDFSSIERARLERAIASLIDGLG